nr:uncharacterized protein LOC124814004 [Hydra vulgaris]
MVKKNKNACNVSDSIERNFLGASAKKVKVVTNVPSKNIKRITGYRIIDTEILSKVLSLLMCPQCEKCALYLGDHQKKKKGLATLLYLKCTTLSCDYKHEFYTSVACDKGFDINNRTIYAMRVLGHGHTGIEKFTQLMNMPKPMTPKNYSKITTKIKNIVKSVANETMSDAATEMKENATSEDIVDVGVSCDGSWQKRGYQSMNGVFTAILIDSGKIIDVEPMNKSCKACCMKEQLKKSNPDAYANWKNKHICLYNYQGTAGGMESVGAVRVFKRSIEKHKLRYTQFLGDGDSKSHLSIKDIYPNMEVKKLECVGHYQKRVGTRLRKLKKNVKGLGGRGRLTNAVIDRLQNFFGVAIRSNTNDLNKMKQAVLASLFHVASSKENNYHIYCPTGGDSWCKFNIDKAKSTSIYKPGPGIPADIIHKIKPIYADLSKDSELVKCLHGKTQNCNESFNNLIWYRLPKSNYVGLASLEFGVYDAVANYNIGMKSVILIYEKLNMKPGHFTLAGCRLINKKRIKLSLFKSSESFKMKQKMFHLKTFTTSTIIKG